MVLRGSLRGRVGRRRNSIKSPSFNEGLFLCYLDFDKRVRLKKVVAVDLSPLCVKTAAKNVELNHQEEIIHVVEGEAEDCADDPADLVVANTKSLDGSWRVFP